MYYKLGSLFRSQKLYGTPRIVDGLYKEVFKIIFDKLFMVLFKGFMWVSVRGPSLLVEARKLEQHYSHAVKVECRGS